MCSNTTSLLAIAVLLSASLTGCHCCRKKTAPPVVIPTVDVGTGVKNPGTLEIPKQGLTLLQAIIRSGGLSGIRSTIAPVNTIDDRPAAQLVRVQRGNEVYHFPLPLVETDLAGAVQVAPGDIVQILPAVETSLHSGELTSSGNTVSISGIHQLSGEYSHEKLKAAVDQGSGDFAMLKNVLSANLSQRGSDLAPVVQLTRTNIRNGYLVEHFVLPTANYPNSDLMLKNLGLDPASPLTAKVQGGDQLVFSGIESVPIVASGVLAPVMYRALSDAKSAQQFCNLISANRNSTAGALR
jgi:hypothetical protein